MYMHVHVMALCILHLVAATGSRSGAPHINVHPSMRSPEDEDDEDELSSADEDGLRGGPRDAGDRDADFDEFEDSTAQYSGNEARAGTQPVQNQPFDEAMELSDSDGNSAQASPMPRGGVAGGAGGANRGGSSSRQRADAVTNQPFDEAMELSSEGSVDGNDDDDDESPSPAPDAPSAKAQMGSSTGMASMGSRPAAPEREQREQMPSQLETMATRPQERKMPDSKGDDDDESDYPDGADGSGTGPPVPEGMYDPEEYANLPVSAEIKELFQYITRYKPHNIELETKMRPFIPDYIPAVGDIDPFIKVGAHHAPISSRIRAALLPSSWGVIGRTLGVIAVFRPLGLPRPGLVDFPLSPPCRFRPRPFSPHHFLHQQPRRLPTQKPHVFRAVAHTLPQLPPPPPTLLLFPLSLPSATTSAGATPRWQGGQPGPGHARRASLCAVRSDCAHPPAASNHQVFRNATDARALD